MTCTVIALNGQRLPVPSPEAAPNPALQHYREQARLAWFEQLTVLLADGVQVFGRLSHLDDELRWLARAKDLLREVEDL